MDRLRYSISGIQCDGLARARERDSIQIDLRELTKSLDIDPTFPCQSQGLGSFATQLTPYSEKETPSPRRSVAGEYISLDK